MILLNDFIKCFMEDVQYIRLFDLANDSEICFEDQISKMPLKYKVRNIIMIEPFYESDVEYFDGYINIYIATKDQQYWYEQYYDVDDEEEED